MVAHNPHLNKNFQENATRVASIGTAAAAVAECAATSCRPRRHHEAFSENRDNSNGDRDVHTGVLKVEKEGEEIEEQEEEE